MKKWTIWNSIIHFPLELHCIQSASSFSMLTGNRLGQAGKKKGFSIGLLFKTNYSLNTFKWHKSNIKNLWMKSSEIVLIFLPALYLIIWLIKFPKNFEKIPILKIWQLVFFWGVKTYWGEKFVIEILIHGSKNCFLCM